MFKTNNKFVLLMCMHYFVWNGRLCRVFMGIPFPVGEKKKKGGWGGGGRRKKCSMVPISDDQEPTAMALVGMNSHHANGFTGNA